MQHPIFFVFFAVFLLSSCASQAPKPKYVDEKNEAKFAHSRSFSESPESVIRAARNVLDELTRESNPQASEAVKAENQSASSGWIYGIAKDKYIQYDYNGTPRRKPLAVRRTFHFEVRSSLSGSQVTMKIKEEIQEIDLKTGESKNWKGVDTDPAAYDLLMQRLKVQLSAQ